MLNGLSKYRDFGILFLRIGVGIMFVLHGQPKLFGGPSKWESVGSAMANLGIDFLHTYWGLAASLTEFVGGICILIGFFFRPAAMLLTFTMVVAALHHLAAGDGVMGASHAIELGVVFFALIFIGPGRFSLDK